MDFENFTFNGTLDVNAIFGIEKDTEFQIILKYICYVLAMIIAFFGNLSVIFVILKTKSLRTKFNIYIVNLALADLFMPLVCMWIHLVNSLNDKWIFGEFMCKIHTFVQVTVVCSSIFTLTVVSFDRFLATLFPSKAWITQSRQITIITFIWISSLSVALPWVLYQFYAEFDWIGGHEIVCQSKFPSLAARKAYYISFFVIVFLVPLLLMFVLIVVTVIKGDNSITERQQTELTSYQQMRRKAVYLLLTILVVFCVCWTPQQSLLVWDVYRKREQMPAGVKNLHYMSLFMAYSSSAINPVVYMLYNKCFRHAAYILCKHCCNGHHSSMTVSPESQPTETIEIGSTSNNTGEPNEIVQELEMQTEP